jgi:hypothetical protein
MLARRRQVQPGVIRPVESCPAPATARKSHDARDTSGARKSHADSTSAGTCSEEPERTQQPDPKVLRPLPRPRSKRPNSLRRRTSAGSLAEAACLEERANLTNCPEKKRVSLRFSCPYNVSGSPAALRVRSARGERRRATREATDEPSPGVAPDATPVHHGLHLKKRARRRQVQPGVIRPAE